MLQYFVQCEKLFVFLLHRQTYMLFSRLLIHQRQGFLPDSMGSPGHSRYDPVHWNACVMTLFHKRTHISQLCSLVPRVPEMAH